MKAVARLMCVRVLIILNPMVSMSCPSDVPEERPIESKAVLYEAQTTLLEVSWLLRSSSSAFRPSSICVPWITNAMIPWYAWSVGEIASRRHRAESLLATRKRPGS